ncbi:hypothetical protein [Pleurocapsa sp. FMAR1]|nr:hypothetical protein [Pleurocapsa sp. FMAR1]
MLSYTHKQCKKYNIKRRTLVLAVSVEEEVRQEAVLQDGALNPLFW